MNTSLVLNKISSMFYQTSICVLFLPVPLIVIIATKCFSSNMSFFPVIFNFFIFHVFLRIAYAKYFFENSTPAWLQLLLSNKKNSVPQTRILSHFILISFLVLNKVERKDLTASMLSTDPL